VPRPGWVVVAAREQRSEEQQGETEPGQWQSAVGKHETSIEIGLPAGTCAWGNHRSDRAGDGDLVDAERLWRTVELFLLAVVVLLDVDRDLLAGECAHTRRHRLPRLTNFGPVVQNRRGAAGVD